MVLTVTEDTPADMLAGSMELLVQMPRDHHVQTQRVTVQRSTPMMDLLVQIATAHKLAASSYTLQAIGERGLVLPHQPNTPIGALDALQVKLLPKQGTFLPRKSRQTNQPFETTFRLQVHLPRNQLYVSRVSPKTNLGEILDEVCREKNLDRNKYELRHPANLAETLDPELTLQDYHLQEVTLCPRQQGRALIGSALSSQDIMALQKQEECRRQQARNNHHHNHHHSTSVFGFMFKKSKESSLSTDSLGNRSVSPARSDETARSSSPIQQQQQMQGEVQMRKEHPPPPPARPLRKRRPAPKPPIQQPQQQQTTTATPTTKTVSRTLSKSASESGSTTTTTAPDKDKIVISHSRNSSDSSGYHEASVLSDNPDNGAGGNGRMPETLPRRGKMQGILESPRKLAHTSQASKSLGNLAIASSHGGTLSRGVSNTSLSSAGQRKKRAAPPPPMARPLPSAISAQGLERIVDSDESLTSDMDLSKPSSDIDVGATGPTGSSSKASSDIGCNSHVRPIAEQPEHAIDNGDVDMDDDHEHNRARVEPARVVKKEPAPPVPKPRKAVKSITSSSSSSITLESSIASRANPQTSCGSSSASSPCPSVVEAASFGLPSLTEDEREEIAQAIDSIFEAAKGHSDTEDSRSSIYGDVVDKRFPERLDDVFLDAEDSRSDALVSYEDVEVPLEFKDSDVNEIIEDKVQNVATVEKITVRESIDSAIVTDEDEQPNDSLKTANSVKIDTVKLVDEPPNPTHAMTITDVTVHVHPTVSEKTEPTNKTNDHETPKNTNEAEQTVSTSKSAESAPAPNVSPREVKFELGDEENNEDTSAPSCAVISTIPKCDHLEPYTDSDFGKSADVVGETGKRRGKIIRSQSEMSHFEVGPAEKHSRHLTSNGEAFTFALNPNLVEAATRRIEASIAGSGKAIPTDTDILLQKVSDTLSHSLPSPPSPPPTPEDASLEPPNLNPATTVHHSAADPPRVINSVAATSTTGDNCANEKSAKSDAQISRTTLSLPESNKPQHQQQQQQHKSEPDEYERLVVTSSADGSANNSASQQDTSDYVSANGEDLSIGDWEYQIPAPPSAFRDDDNDSVNNVPAPAPIRVTTTTISNAAVSAKAVVEHAAVKPIKEPISIEAEIHYRAPEKHAKPSTLTVELTKQSSPHPKPTRQSEPEHQSAKIDSTVDSVDFCQPQKPTPKLSSPQLSNEATELKKAEVINELETKIQSNRPIVEPVTTRDESYAPKIAPVENNLSNFTITTYSRQKSLDIFEQIDQQQQQLHNDNRVLNTFATLTRGRSTAADYADEKVTRNGRLKNAQSMERMSVPLVDDKAKFAERNDMPREKATVHRSKSYIILSSNEKFQNRANEMDKSRDERKVDDRFAYDSSDSTKKYTSLANVNASTNEEIPRHKEKFSQWRDNILRKQEEPTKEKQLQSLQVLKSILPQLKNAQATEENGYKSTSDNFTTKKRQESQHEHKPPRDSSPISTNATSTTTTTATSTEVQMRANRRDHEPAKRYTYSGPPAISLGSWSERPCVNVQIKTDTDYKFGGRSNKSGNNNNSSSASGARTVVSLNGGETHNSVRTQNGGIVESVHTKVATTPVEIEKEDESRVDTTSVNFRELTKAFGQADVRLRPKPPATPARNPHNRLSEYIERPKPEIVPKQNGFADSHVVSTTSFGVSHNRANPPAPPIRRYTSVVGIMNNNNIISNKNGISSQPTNFRFVNGQTKTFNGQKERDYAVPKPPTMPIITGVTLKSVSARPKSSPATIQADPRDQLLESIRNFGGREKLKSAAERY